MKQIKTGKNPQVQYQDYLSLGQQQKQITDLQTCKQYLQALLFLHQNISLTQKKIKQITDKRRKQLPRQKKQKTIKPKQKNTQSKKSKSKKLSPQLSLKA